MGIKILTDTCWDLDFDMAKKYDIDLVPLIVHDEEENSYEDMFEMKPETLYSNMRKGTVYKTSQVPYVKFKEKFTEYAEAGDKCIYIAFSSGLSGTYQTGVLAAEDTKKEYPEFEVTVIDSKCACTGQGLLVLYASMMREKGMSYEEIIEKTEEYKSQIDHVFTVDDLQYLYRGGRLSKTAAFFGGLLNVKPILELLDGKITPYEKERGRKKALKRMVDLMGERSEEINQQLVFVAQGDCLEDAEYVRKLIMEKYGVKEVLISEIGSVIGSHVGPGVLSLFYLKKDYKI